MSLACSQEEIYGLVYKGLITVLVLVPVLNAPESHESFNTGTHREKGQPLTRHEIVRETYSRHCQPIAGRFWKSGSATLQKLRSKLLTPKTMRKNITTNIHTLCLISTLDLLWPSRH
jgi:hypothetical protein